MKRIILVFVILIISSFQFNFTVPQDPYKIKVVVIDAGHGGHDSGALGKHSKEKDIALAIALKTGAYIKKVYPDIKIIYTRKTDVFIELWRRAKIANQAQADLFISIHCNAIDNPRPYGTETWVMGVHKSAANLAVAKKENAAILKEANHLEKYDNFNPNSPESYIAFSLFQSAFRDQSIDLATKVQNQFKTRVGRSSRGVKEAGFLVLWKTSMPSILIETGFISNPKEEKFLISENGQDLMASGIYRAFKSYKKEMEGANYSEGGETQAVPQKVTPEPDPEETPSKKDPSAEVKDNPEIYFGVQFTTTKDKKPSSSAAFKGIENVWNYYHTGLYKYVAGKYESVEQANEHLKSIRELGFSDAFIVAFKDGKRISPKEAIKLISQKSHKD